MSPMNRLRGDGGLPVASHALPPSVEVALDGLTVVVRGDDGEGRPRVLLQFADSQGATGWYHERETTRKRIGAVWPELNEPQLDRACRAIAAKVAVAHNGGPLRERQRSEWASWAPLQMNR